MTIDNPLLAFLILLLFFAFGWLLRSWIHWFRGAPSAVVVKIPDDERRTLKSGHSPEDASHIWMQDGLGDVALTGEQHASGRERARRLRSRGIGPRKLTFLDYLW